MIRQSDQLPSLWAVLALALVISLMPGATPAAPILCPDTMISVEAKDQETRVLVCDTVVTTLPRLADCGLDQRLSLTIDVVDRVMIGDVPCLATFDCSTHTITLTHPDALALRLAETPSPLSLLEPEPLIRSLIVHELSHALFDQMSIGSARSAANHEYVAYAMQLASLPADQRQLLLDAHPVTGPISEMELNEFIAAMAPFQFASKVWAHFSTPENGCAFIGKLVSGKADLALGPL